MFTENDEKKTYNFFSRKYYLLIFRRICGNGEGGSGEGNRECVCWDFIIFKVYDFIWWLICIYIATFEPYTGVSLMKQTFIFYGKYSPKNTHCLFFLFLCKHQGMKNRINIQWSWQIFQILLENLLHPPFDSQNTQSTPLLLFRSCRVNDFAVSPLFSMLIFLVYLMCLCAFDVLMLCIPFELRIKFNNFSIQYYLQRENP